MEDVMVTVKVPRSFSYDMFDGSLYCYSSDSESMKCVFCPYLGTIDCIAVKIRTSYLCVEEEEVTSAVAGVGNSSYRNSETASSGESQSEALC